MNNFTSYKEDSVASAAAQVLTSDALNEGVVTFPSYRAKGKGIYTQKDALKSFWNECKRKNNLA